MPRVGELLWRVVSSKRLGLVAQGVEDEGDLEPVACTEASIERR